MEDNLDWPYEIRCIPDGNGKLLYWQGATQYYLKPKDDEWLRVQVEYRGHFIGLMCMKERDGRYGWLSIGASPEQEVLPFWDAIQIAPGWAVVERVVEKMNELNQ